MSTYTPTHVTSSAVEKNVLMLLPIESIGYVDVGTVIARAGSFKPFFPLHAFESSDCQFNQYVRDISDR